jgi:hypothetical protein
MLSKLQVQLKISYPIDLLQSVHFLLPVSHLTLFFVPYWVLPVLRRSSLGGDGFFSSTLRELNRDCGFPHFSFEVFSWMIFFKQKG